MYREGYSLQLIMELTQQLILPARATGIPWRTVWEGHDQLSVRMVDLRFNWDRTRRGRGLWLLIWSFFVGGIGNIEGIRIDFSPQMVQGLLSNGIKKREEKKSPGTTK